MTIRQPTAIGWYPSRADDCARTIDGYLARDRRPAIAPPPLGGLVPHAGWAFSGRCAATTFAALAACEPAPEVVLVLGAVHAHGVDGPTACDHEAWQTPFGPLPVDAPLRQTLRDAALIRVDSRAHADEHSIEVQVPLIRHLLPRASFLPVAVPPSPDAADFGRALAGVLAEDGRAVGVVASSDLTHYGAAYGFAPGGGGEAGLAWARANDEELLRRVVSLDAEGVLDHARRRRSACGAGALAAAMTCAAGGGARRAVVLERTSSHEEAPERGGALWVGYAAAVFSA